MAGLAMLCAVLLLSCMLKGLDAVVSLRRAPGLDGLRRFAVADRPASPTRHRKAAKASIGALELHQHTDFLHQEMHLMMDEDGSDGDDGPLEAQLDDSWATERPGAHSLGMLWKASERSAANRDDDKPPGPLPIYEDADAAANYLESQRGSEFFPDGAQSDLDVAPDQRRALKNAFEERPDLFENCILIRDFAEPLRVGSSISDSELEPAPAPKSTLVNDTLTDKKPLPEEVLTVKGGIFDRDAGKSEEAEPQVNMFAFLRSIAGEVAVIPNGDISRWSSKKKVPIAGYLCTEDGHRVLYTLPTPCLATSLDDDGMPRPPPPHRPPVTVPAPAPAPAPAAAPSPASSVPSGLSSFLSTGSRSGDNQSFSKQGSSLDPNEVEPATSDDFVVFVGSKKLFFSSKGKAEAFCMRLTESIADDMGDHEFDMESLSPTSLRKDVKAGEFLQLVRKKAASAWTTGTKKLLVVVMDWKPGDNSRRPYSRQTKSVAHYRDKIFPQVRSAFLRMSYGQFDIRPTFVPEVIRYSSYRSRYATQGYPFPGLYIGAEESLARSVYSSYRFSDYDLVYVISPQQAPTGTRGVAWVGAKGAICNGCEEISESFQVMVAVHELGHNLGLAHASSKSLEYGNPFDWMGNYPDVVGLSFGAGYKLRLGWLRPDSVATIQASEFAGLNDRFVLRPFDVDSQPAAGELVAIELKLPGSSNDLFISYRKTAGTEKGVYVVLQDKGKPDSELVDMACHTSSQKDARLQKHWTYLDPSQKVAVYLEDVTDGDATLHLFAVQSSQISAIRGLAKFTDGQYKCPRTCTDSDLLVAQYQGCSVLAGQGYCNGGSITTGGVSKSIGVDICPKSCGNCAQVLAGPPEVGSSSSAGASTGCDDRNILIGGKNCWEARLAGYCDRGTNLGHVGRDLCPKSCGNCPPAPPPANSNSGFRNPIPARTRGGSFVASAAVPATVSTQAATQTSESTTEAAATETAATPAPAPCADSATWSDSDGHGCTVYAAFIEAGKLTQSQACNYGDGSAMLNCKKTCDQCDSASTTTAAPLTTTEAPTTSAAPAADDSASCEDAECIESWYQSFGQCFKCKDYADTYCGQDALFMQSCPKSCKLCSVSPPPPCDDDFKKESCQEWSALGFCDQPKIGRSCKKTCGLCGDSPTAAALDEDQGYLGSAYGAVFGPSETQIVDEHWEWGTRHALKDAVKQEKKRTLRITDAQYSGALQFGLTLHALVMIMFANCL